MNWKTIYKPLEKFGLATIEFLFALLIAFLTGNANYLFLVAPLRALENMLKHTFLPKFLNWLSNGKEN